MKTKLDPLKISFHTIELDLLPGSQASDLQSALAEKLGKSRVTVPQVSFLFLLLFLIYSSSLKAFISAITHEDRYITSSSQIFINQQPIGGCDDLLSLEKRGELDQILSKLQSQS